MSSSTLHRDVEEYHFDILLDHRRGFRVDCWGRSARSRKRGTRSDDRVAEQIVEAPALGKVLRVYVEVGKPVAEGDPICLMEALKMELPIVAPVGGTVKALPIAAGQNVEAGDPLAVIES